MHTLALQFDATWTRTDEFAILSLFVGFIGSLAALLALWPHIRQRILERRLSRRFGADLYLPEVIRDAVRWYIRPDASSVDLSQEMEERSNRIPTREDLFRAVRRFLDDASEHRHMLLLADSGMGKSAFVLNFYAHEKRRFRRKRHRLAVIPLGHPKALERIRDIQDKRETTIFLDAFDEDPKARDNYWGRLKTILEECSEFKRILMTCRTQFFPKDDAIPVGTGMVKVGPRNDKAHYEFWRLYIAPFSDDQVDMYLRRRFRFNRWKRSAARKIILKIPLLTIRPMLLANVPDIMAHPVEVRYTSDLYDLMVSRWYRRELGWWPDMETIQTFSEEIAVKLYVSFSKNGSTVIPRVELAEFVNNLPVPIEEWNVTSRSLLHRDAEGNFKFAHRSIMEYLVVKRFMDNDKRCLEVDWTVQMQTFLWEMTESELDKPTMLWIGNSRQRRKPIEAKGADLALRMAIGDPPPMRVLVHFLRSVFNPNGDADICITILRAVSQPLRTTNYKEDLLRGSFQPIPAYSSAPISPRDFSSAWDLLIPTSPTIGHKSNVDFLYSSFAELPTTARGRLRQETRAVIIAPIAEAGRVVGLFIGESNQEDSFSEKTLVMLTELLDLMVSHI